MSKTSSLGVLVLLIFLCAGVLAARSILMGSTTISIEERVLEATTKNNPEYMHDGKPVIEVVSVSSFDTWHIATIKSLRSTDTFVPVKIVLLDTSGILRVVAGPDTHFTEKELLEKNAPDSVILELQK